MLVTGDREGFCLVWEGNYLSGAYSDVQYKTAHADVPAAKARTLVMFGAQGVIWLIICKQMSMLNDHNQLRNAPCSFYAGPTKIACPAVSTGN